MIWVNADMFIAIADGQAGIIRFLSTFTVILLTVNKYSKSYYIS